MTAAWPLPHAAHPDTGRHRHRAQPSRQPEAVVAAGVSLVAAAVWVGVAARVEPYPAAREVVSTSVPVRGWPALGVVVPVKVPDPAQLESVR